ncbi:MAG: dihydrofolate reductase family protein [Candidatus Magasanikbacteria bacterium]|nr:dihydrofolate reductase family protein [Candidatus Magasanikbacteria bacterium]
MKKPNYIAIAATTIDGRIAKHSRHFSSWTSKEDKDFLHAILDTCDVILVGRSTYDMAKKPLSKRNCIVLTRDTANKKDTPGLTYINPTKKSLPQLIKKCDYKKIGILGGEQIYSYCLEKNLLDELFLTIEPVSFGFGLSLFKTKKLAQWKLKSIKKLNNKGTILLHYLKSYGK